LVLSLSNSIRSTAILTDPQFTKTVFLSAAYIHVRWGWLAFPVAMVLASIILLIISIVLAFRGHMDA